VAGGGEPAIGGTSSTANVTATPSAPTTDLANPATPGIGTDPALNPPPSVTAEEKAPALKPVYPATDWSPPTKTQTSPISSKKLAASKLATSKHVVSKHGKKIKATARKPTKAECKKFAKNAKEAKKHKKELAICKAERKKALLKAKAKKAHD
jgi:hypothetical protein